MEQALLTRDQVAPADCWNVEALYPSLEAWQKDLKAFCPSNGEPPPWNALSSYQGALGKSAETVLTALSTYFSLAQTLDRLYTYAQLKHDENLTSDPYKTALGTITNVLHTFQQDLAWFEPELLKLPDEKIDLLIQDPSLKPYRFHLEKLFHLKQHTLTPKEELLLALANPALQTSQKAFSALNDADLEFGSVTDPDTKAQKPITHGTFILYLRHPNQSFRKNTFETLYKTYQGHVNTLAELLQGAVHSHLFQARAHNYTTCLDAALFPKNIPSSLYHNLIETVQENLAPLHRYLNARSRALKLETAHVYDIYVPLVPHLDKHIPYHEAEELVIEAVAPLGSAYQNRLKKGLKEERWVDRYENKNKRSGAYSGGCYDSFPYILHNYSNTIHDVFTLAHEAGHSMHTFLSAKHQPYHYSSYTIFVAEVASTFNEDLLLRLLLERATSDEEKIFLISTKLDDIRGNLFRQTSFAAFELFLHTAVEQNQPLTPQLLQERYLQTIRPYFPEALVLDEAIQYEWARIPHFYYNFYVYQYATGISAALALSQRVVEGSTTEQEDYLRFLQGGCNQYPLDLLKTAGVDMTTPAPILSAIKQFDHWVGELEKLLSS